MIIYSRRSFTLLELLLVMLILMILVGLAVPNFSGTYQKMVLRQSADELADLMRFAQSKAVLTQTVFQMSLDEQAGTYQLNREKIDKSLKKTFEPLEGSSGLVKRIPKQIKMTGGVETMLFKPDGTIERIEIKLCDRSFCFIISTAKRRGLVKVIPEQPSDVKKNSMP